MSGTHQSWLLHQGLVPLEQYGLMVWTVPVSQIGYIKPRWECLFTKALGTNGITPTPSLSRNYSPVI